MSNEILYIFLPDYAAHEAVYLSQAIASDEFALKENPKYLNKVVAPTLEPVYTPVGYADRVFHIHFHYPGDNDEIAFRDYLIAHPETAKEYEQLKCSLLPACKNNRDGYTQAKTDFVRLVVELSRRKGK